MCVWAAYSRLHGMGFVYGDTVYKRIASCLYGHKIFLGEVYRRKEGGNGLLIDLTVPLHEL